MSLSHKTLCSTLYITTLQSFPCSNAATRSRCKMIKMGVFTKKHTGDNVLHWVYGLMRFFLTMLLVWVCLFSYLLLCCALADVDLQQYWIRCLIEALNFPVIVIDQDHCSEGPGRWKDACLISLIESWLAKLKWRGFSSVIVPDTYVTAKVIFANQGPCQLLWLSFGQFWWLSV